MWFLPSWPWGFGSEPPCWLGGRRQQQARGGAGRPDKTQPWVASGEGPELECLLSVWLLSP